MSHSRRTAPAVPGERGGRLIRTGRITFVTTALDFSRTQPARQERTRAEGRPSADVSRTRKATGSAGFLAGMDARLLLHLAWRGNMRPMPIQLQRHGNRRSGRWKARQPRRSTPITHRRRPSCRRSDSRFVSDWPNADPIGELGFELIRSAGKPKRTLDINLYAFVLNNPVNNVDYLGLSSLVAQFWAALAAGDLEMAALILEELGASSYPALAAALANAQRIADLISRISINWQHASRCCRLGNMSLDQATKAIAEVIAKGGTTFKTWVQGGQTMVSGTFTANGVTYSFTGRVTPEGLYQIGTVCEGVHRLAK